jgi:hypothetical protein
MLVYSFVEVARPFEEAEPILEKLLDGASEAADIAYRRGEELLAEVGPYRRFLAKTVRVDTGEALRAEGETTIPLTWEATGAPGLFPRMEADVVLARMGPRHSHLSFRGSYEPPFGRPRSLAGGGGWGRCSREALRVGSRANASTE